MTLKMHPPRKPVAAASATPRRARKATLVAWLLVLAFTEFSIWAIYEFSATSGGAGCGEDFLPAATGGAASNGSALTAALLGWTLWLSAGVAALRLRRELGLLFVGSVALYVVALVVLFYVSPLFWGPRHC